jgi:hypothetical protein
VRYEERGEGHRDVEKVGKHWPSAFPTRVLGRARRSSSIGLAAFLIGTN